MRNVITPMRHPSLFNSSLLRQKRGVLLYGPPGTGALPALLPQGRRAQQGVGAPPLQPGAGKPSAAPRPPAAPPPAGKTMLAKALARECDACFILLKSSTILRCGAGRAQRDRGGVRVGSPGCQVQPGLAHGQHCPHGRPTALLPPTSPPCLHSKWYGDSNKLVAAVWSLANKLQPCILFIGARPGPGPGPGRRAAWPTSAPPPPCLAPTPCCRPSALPSTLHRRGGQPAGAAQRAGARGHHRHQDRVHAGKGGVGGCGRAVLCFGGGTCTTFQSHPPGPPRRPGSHRRLPPAVGGL